MLQSLTTLEVLNNLETNEELFIGFHTGGTYRGDDVTIFIDYIDDTLDYLECDWFIVDFRVTINCESIYNTESDSFRYTYSYN